MMQISSPTASRKLGFSLVELSIVLVILGLLVGGVLSGQSLIRAAELRSLTTDTQRFIAATIAFKDKYFGLPGDMSNATAYWGKDGTNCASDTGNVDTTRGTCNGNGDGIMEFGTVNGGTGEAFQFWRQLALAGLIEGSYTGIAGPGNTINAIRGVNTPAAKPNYVGWNIQYATAASVIANATPNIYVLEYGNYFSLGAKTTSTGGFGQAYAKPEDAWNIDTKMDDGKPASGMVIAKFWNNQCSGPNSGAATNINYDASYLLTVTTPQCALFFRQLF
ncbi:MAG: prepilin-type N-terminal cleavage/methylation domain-containing protein [Rickettsiales bacterium]|nr:prepilin-type N-terminal cleavage/methylation domain-containing protein [Rickettsiales bacterium]